MTLCKTFQDFLSLHKPIIRCIISISCSPPFPQTPFQGCWGRKYCSNEGHMGAKSRSVRQDWLGEHWPGSSRCAVPAGEKGWT